MEDFLVLLRAARSLQNRAGFSGKLEHTGPDKKGGLSATKRATGKDARAAFSTRKRNRAICPDREMGESQGKREPHLVEKEKGQNGSMERQKWTLK